MAVPHITVDDVVDRLDRGERPSGRLRLRLLLAVVAVAAVDLAVAGTDAPVLLWVPVVTAAAVTGLRAEAVASVALAVVVGVATVPDGSGPGVVAGEAAGRAIGLVVVVAATTWVVGAGRELVRRSRCDGPTGLLNATSFAHVLERERQRAVRLGVPLSLVYLDLDGLKVVNDRDGHAAGDVLLARFADRLEACRRTVDVAARLGGDEFALLLPGTDARGTTELLTRLFRDDGPDRCPSASAGAVCWTSPPPAEEMLRAADSVMYRVKRRGGRTWEVVVDVSTDLVSGPSGRDRGPTAAGR